MNKNVVYGLVAVVIVAAVGWFGYMYVQNQSADSNTAQTNNSSAPTPTPTVAKSASEHVTYQGEEGKTALALLQENAEVEMTGEGEMAFVTTINGYTAKDNEFWAFYVNGEQAQVGAGTYVTKADDEVMWMIETF